MIFPLIFLAFLILLDLYVFRGINLLTKDFSVDTKKFIKWSYWIISIAVLVISIGGVLWSIFKGKEPIQPKYWIATIWIAFLTPKLFFSLFLLPEDIVHLFRTGDIRIKGPGDPISRFSFLSKLGFGVFSLTLFYNFFGIFFTKFRYKVRREVISFPNLPQAFDGYKVVQFSDLHIGSLNGNFNPLKKAFGMINELKPDLLLFTGDMVNNIASELDGADEVMHVLEAKDGKFSIMGNHDYGDYYYPKKSPEHAANLKRIKERQVELGFDLILNESRKIEKDGEFIDLIGVENWGKGWGSYGDLEKASANANGPFKILMSHDPSHWKHQVKEKTNIDLTLSGHTHGFQYGIEWLGIKLSPVQLAYDTWAGLYNAGKQYIYVNRGLGFIGFLGRVGIRPEITEITLRKG